MSAIDKMLLEQARANAADQAAPYRELANKVAMIAGAKGKLSEKVTEAGYNLWESFKESLDTALSADHTATSMRIGLTVAMTDAAVPPGSFRSYVATVTSLYERVQGGTLTQTDAKLLKIKDARELVQDEGKKALREARNRLAEASKDFEVADIDELVEYSKAMIEERKAAEEAAEAARKAA